ncbi:MAG TPA: 3'-5' exonuclease [Bryobacteraceae bacterium]|nr:3'-5' exonuclease [Bryobacteraceae bacterium]
MARLLAGFLVAAAAALGQTAPIAAADDSTSSALVLVLLVAALLIAFLLFWVFTADGREARQKPQLRSLPSRNIYVPERFVVFDLETTGLDPSRHEIIEIGAIKVNRDSDVHESFQTLLRPTKRISTRVTEINGITQEMTDRDGEPAAEGIKAFLDFIGDLPLVSYNADFDMDFLRASARRHRLLFHNRATCALKMARRAWPGRESYRLSDLARDGNLSTEDAHRALGDCKRTVIVYMAAASKLGDRKRYRGGAPK